VKDNGGAHDLWDEESEELSEDVAERQQVEKAERVEDALVLEVWHDLALEGFEVREDVLVGDDDALGFGCSSGGEDDLHGISALESGGCVARVGVVRYFFREVFEN
jgi:hypothetical protein